MVSSTPCCKKPDRLSLRLFRGLLLVSLLVLQAAPARAEGIHIKSAELSPTDSGYALEANFDIMLSHTLEEALLRGVSLPFVLEFELTYPRWWTFSLWNRTVAELRQEHRLSYNALTRQYRVLFGNLHQNFDTLAEALAVMGRVRQRHVATRDQVDPETVYIAGVRLRLDTSQLPKPLQIDALGSRDWTLSSDWYRWTFRP
jgi:Domain of unknown function (DUF4390)